MPGTDEPELVGEQRAGAGERTQGVGLPSGVVQRQHQSADQPLAQRVLVGHPLDPVAASAARPSDSSASYLASIAESRSSSQRATAGCGPLLVVDVDEARTPPLPQCGVEEVEGGAGLVGEHPVGPTDGILPSASRSGRS